MGWDNLTRAAGFRMKTPVGLGHLVDQRVGAGLLQGTGIESNA